MEKKTDPSQTQIQTDSVQIQNGSVQTGFWGYLKNGNLQLVVTLATVAIALFNLWIGSKLIPIANDITAVAKSVSANAERIDSVEGVTSLYLPRYLATEQQVISIKESISRIEASQVRQEAKLDSVILRSQ